MKKLITILLVLALVLALAPMALASEEAAVGEDTVEEPEELGQIEETEEEAAGPIDEPAPPATSGTFGLGMAWELSEDGVLTISGTGPMWLMGMPVTLFNGSADPGTPWIDVTWGDPQPPLPWREVTERIKTVIIEPGVTDISANAFYLCNSITSVTIPDTVTSISACAFYFCRNLQDVYYTGS